MVVSLDVSIFRVEEQQPLPLAFKYQEDGLVDRSGPVLRVGGTE